MADDPKLEAILYEATEIQAGIERSYGAIHTSFGLVLPALIGVFAFLVETESSIEPEVLATLFILVFTLGSLWSQSSWMELLRYVRYKYVVLVPRLYAASGQGGSPSFLQWSGRRGAVSWLPIRLFNLGALVVLVVAQMGYVQPSDRWQLAALGWCFIGAVVASSVAVFVEAGRVEREILASSPLDRQNDR